MGAVIYCTLLYHWPYITTHSVVHVVICFLHFVIHAVIVRDLSPVCLHSTTSRLMLVLGVLVDNLHHNIIPVLRVDPVVVVDVVLESAAANPPWNWVAERQKLSQMLNDKVASACPLSKGRGFRLWHVLLHLIDKFQVCKYLVKLSGGQIKSLESTKHLLQQTRIRQARRRSKRTDPVIARTRRIRSVIEGEIVAPFVVKIHLNLLNLQSFSINWIGGDTYLGLQLLKLWEHRQLLLQLLTHLAILKYICLIIFKLDLELNCYVSRYRPGQIIVLHRNQAFVLHW